MSCGRRAQSLTWAKGAAIENRKHSCDPGQERKPGGGEVGCGGKVQVLSTDPEKGEPGGPRM